MFGIEDHGSIAAAIADTGIGGLDVNRSAKLLSARADVKRVQTLIIPLESLLIATT